MLLSTRIRQLRLVLRYPYLFTPIPLIGGHCSRAIPYHSFAYITMKCQMPSNSLCWRIAMSALPENHGAQLQQRGNYSFTLMETLELAAKTTFHGRMLLH